MASPKKLTKKECKERGFRYRKEYSYERQTKDGLKTIKVKANCTDPSASKKKKSPVKKSKSPKVSGPPLSSYQKKKKTECEKQGKRYVRPYQYEKDGKIIKVRSKCYDIKESMEQVSSDLFPKSVLTDGDLIITKYDENDEILTKNNIDKFDTSDDQTNEEILMKIMYQLAEYIFYDKKLTEDTDEIKKLSEDIYDYLYLFSDFLRKKKINSVVEMNRQLKNSEIIYAYLDAFDIKFNITKGYIFSINEVKYNNSLIPTLQDRKFL